MAKIWKKLGLLIVVIACIVNIVMKLSTRVTLSSEITASVDYIKDLVHVQEVQKPQFEKK